jgi:hypothetical protein
MSETKTEKAVGYLAMFLIGWALVVPLALWFAVCFVPLWRWYMAPLGLPQIGYLHAAGLSLVVGLLTSRADTTKRDFDGEIHAFSARLSHAVAYPPLCLLLGWVLHLLQ